ncbi:hypothetical protein [Steroidobacter sp.]|uniref:hypothetical protein n=1 Tax=Steroidobacter sp. TaxID=1978227 RepID=UPI001A436926|nr:hypothetical protein [Steroidobacter sp.]MBL8267236.1 hypothetical protein [Steroidobacter sp.]
MGWLGAIGVGLVSAPLTGIIIGTAAGLCADWMRMPNREGAVGYFAVAMTLLGAFFGLLLAIVIARGWFGITGGFGKTLALTVGPVLAVSLVVTGLVWLTADSNPEIDGRELDLAVELRYPVGVAPTIDGADPYITFIKLSDGSSEGYARLEIDKAQQIDGRFIVPATLRIQTSAKRKVLSARLSQEQNLLFAPDFDAQPGQKDLQWSRWIDAAYPLGETAPPADKTFAARYQVRLVEPPPPTPTAAEQEAAAEAEQEAKMRALAPDAPLEQWLLFTRYGVPQTRIDAAVAAIRQRPQFASEMTALLTGDFSEASQDALRSLTHMQPPPTELGPAVVAAGSAIAKALRELVLPPGPEQDYADAAAISPQFSAWMEAARALQGKDGIDLVPQLQEIIVPARAHPDSHVLRIDVVRVASYYLQQWGNIEPLPTDPPPR